MKKKILIFTNIPSPYKVELYNELSKHIEVNVVFDGYSDGTRNEKWFNYDFKFKAFSINKFDFYKLYKIVKNNYNHIIIDNYATPCGGFLITFLKFKHIPYILYVDGGFPKYNDNLVARSLKRYCISGASLFLSSGKETNKYLEYYGADINNIQIVPLTSLRECDILKHPIDYQQKMKKRSSAGYNYKRLFISVGSFIYRKGYDIFFESIKDFKDENTGFLIIGGGPLKSQYLETIKKYDLLNVHLIDFCTKDILFEYFQMSDVFFFPSREDIWGLVINEAMANGLPIISSNNVIAARELIEKDFLFSPEDKGEMIRIINQLICHDLLELQKIGQINIFKIQDYTIEKASKKLLEIL